MPKNNKQSDIAWKRLDKKTEKKINRNDMQIVFGGILFFCAFAFPAYWFILEDDKKMLIIPYGAFGAVFLLNLFFILFPYYRKWYYIEGRVIEKLEGIVDVETDDGKVLESVVCDYPLWEKLVIQKSRVAVWRNSQTKPYVRKILSEGETMEAMSQKEQKGLVRIRLTDELRMEIASAAKPDMTSYWTYSTMDLATGIWDFDTNFWLAKIYHLHEGIRRSGENFSEYRFLLFANGKAYRRDCHFYTDTKEYRLLDAADDCPLPEDKVLEMVQFYLQDYNYLQELSMLAKKQYGLEGNAALDYNKIFLQEHYSA